MKKIIIVILVIIIIYIGAKFLFIDSNKKVQIDMQNLAEELINSISHGIGVLLEIIALVLTVVF